MSVFYAHDSFAHNGQRKRLSARHSRKILTTEDDCGIFVRRDACPDSTFVYDASCVLHLSALLFCYLHVQLLAGSISRGLGRHQKSQGLNRHAPL